MNTDQTTPKNIDEYIAGFPKDIQAILEQVRNIIREAAPQAQETIKYRMPTYVLEGNLVHFAGYKKHIGFYPTPSGIEKFRDAISSYKWAKGSVQFPFDRSIPYDLIRDIVIFRVQENLARTPYKKR